MHTAALFEYSAITGLGFFENYPHPPKEAGSSLIRKTILEQLLEILSWSWWLPDLMGPLGFEYFNPYIPTQT